MSSSVNNELDTVRQVFGKFAVDKSSQSVVKTTRRFSRDYYSNKAQFYMASLNFVGLLSTFAVAVWLNDGSDNSVVNSCLLYTSPSPRDRG